MTPPPTPPEPATAGTDARQDPRSTGEVVRSVTTGSQALLRKELELAKLEIAAIVKARAAGIALVSIAGVLGLYILGFAGVTVAVALSGVVAAWLAWLLVTLGYTLVAVVLVLVAIRKFKQPPGTPERTKQAYEETRDWAQKRAERITP